MKTIQIRSGIGGFAADNHPYGKVAGGHVDGLRRVAEAQIRATTPSHVGAVRAIHSGKA